VRHFRGRRKAGECRKLHAIAFLLALIGATLAVPRVARTQPVRTELPPFLSQADRAALRARIAAATLSVRRTVPPPKGITAPNPDVRFGAGICPATGRILTAYGLVADWPLAGRNGEDRLEVSGADGVKSMAAVGQTDSRLGVAVLDAVVGATCLPPEFAGPGDGDAGLGVVLYAVVAGASGLAEVAIRGPGQGPLAWYVVAEGAVLPVGTPLFSGRGTFVTLVGAVDSEQPGRLFLLPASAIRLIFEERFRWDR
jgi:hypothetical protein